MKQAPPSTNGSTTWDVVVIGAGVAGATAARLAARKGLEVLLVDQRQFPRYKVCGGCLSPRAVALLAASGITDLRCQLNALPLEQFELLFRGFQTQLPLTGGLAISREELDALLVQRAVDSGAIFSAGTRARVLPSDDNAPCRLVELTADGTTRPVEARAVILASGLAGSQEDVPTHSAHHSVVGLGTTHHPLPFLQTGVVRMHVGDSGYLGMVRVDDQRVNLAASIKLSRLRDCGSAQAAVEALLEETNSAGPWAADVQHWKGTGPLSRQRQKAEHRLFAVGDAAGYVEPFTGEGMTWALQSGMLAVQSLPASVRDWNSETESRYEAEYLRLISGPQRRCQRVAGLLRYRWLASAAFRLLHAFPRVEAACVRQFSSTTAADLKVAAGGL